MSKLSFTPTTLIILFLLSILTTLGSGFPFIAPSSLQLQLQPGLVAVLASRGHSSRSRSRSHTSLKDSPTTTSAVDGDSESSSSSSSSPSSIAEQILHDFHQSDLYFRIIVIGNGAILEATSKLGPLFKPSLSSKKTGQRLITFANSDASLEFHVQVTEIAKIVFVVSNNNTSSATPDRHPSSPQSQTRRVTRFINANGVPICSLLLAESSNNDEGRVWFENMMETYGSEVVL